MQDTETMVVLMPAYKPQEPLLDLSRQLLALGFSLVVVNDGSGVDYDVLFGQLPKETVVVTHEVNLGKGQALKTGLSHIKDHYPDATVVITADADGQHLPEDIYKVGKALQDFKQSIVIGTRRFRGNIPFKSRFGNTLTRWLFAMATRVRVYDTQSGLRAFSPAEIPFMLSVPGDRYEYELNVLMWATRKKISLREVSIHTVYEPGNPTSHFNVILDSYRIYAQLFKFSLSSFGSFWVDYIALLTFRWLLFSMGPSASLLYSSIIARVLSATFNYTINRNWVFRSHANIKKTVGPYFLTVIGLWGCNYSLLYLMHFIGNVPLWLAKPIVDMVLFFLSYNIQKKYVFPVFQD